jgi:hypothetical protein
VALEEQVALEERAAKVGQLEQAEQEPPAELAAALGPAAVPGLAEASRPAPLTIQ